MIKLCCSKKAEIGMTMTLVVATIIIVFLLGILFVGTVAWLLKKTPNTEIESANSVHQKRMMQNQLMVFLNTEVEFLGGEMTNKDLIILVAESNYGDESWQALRNSFANFAELSEANIQCSGIILSYGESASSWFFKEGGANLQRTTQTLEGNFEALSEEVAMFKVLKGDLFEIYVRFYIGRC